ncbi:MAG: TatD family hydrolase [Candidatus Cloacimonetes bacterium]|nr:TatD family hydrolase [Candidatus Cloacimonadota bacterium]
MCFKNWIDSHCHLVALDNPALEISEAEKLGVDGFITIALNQRELNASLELETPSTIILAGVHPYYSGSKNSFIDSLADLLDSHSIEGIGEIGLDKRNKDMVWQKDILLQQLDIADQYDVPVSFHCVKMYYELYKIIKTNFPGIRGILHGFNGNSEIIREFSKFDIAYSVSPGILSSPDAKEVLSLLATENKLLLETDAPNTHHTAYEMKTGGLAKIPKFAQQIASFIDISIEELKDIQLLTFNKYFS